MSPYMPILDRGVRNDGYISTAKSEEEIDLKTVHADLVGLEQQIQAATDKHNGFLKELGLPLLP